MRIKGEQAPGPLLGRRWPAIPGQEWQDLLPEPAAHLGWVSPNRKERVQLFHAPSPGAQGREGSWQQTPRRLPNLLAPEC